jgi:hypothetical protein
VIVGVARVLPSPIHRRLRSMARVRRLRDRITARSLANGSKRLDLAAAQVAQLLHLSDVPSVEGRVCLELGSGWVLTHALVMHLLGATRIIATDLEAVAHLGVIRRAVHAADEAAVRDILAPFSSHSAVRERLATLRTIRTFDRQALAGLGIDYRAPIDLAVDRINEPIDLVYSFSVLEHVSIESLPLLLANVTADLRPGGVMLHAVHLEDHLDSTRPFAFLGTRSVPFDADLQASRGNRLRGSELLRTFNDVPDLEASLLYAWQRTDRPLPDSLDPAITFTDEADLRTSHVGILARQGPP